MTDFFTSDTHFGHANIIAYCKRPFASVEEMNDTMIERWNVVVGPGDTVYHLGDFAMGPKALWRSYRERLNGRVVFVMGNHDAPFTRFRTECLLDDDLSCDEYIYTAADGKKIHLAHIPMRGDPDRGFVRPMKLAQTGECSIFLCGHVHSEWKVDVGDGWVCVNVGVDQWNFTPRTLDEILACI